MLDHVGMQCADIAASAAFYDAVLAPLGGARIMDFGEAIGYGLPPHADFWISQQATGEGFRESHISFTAADLHSPSSPVAQGAVGSANLLTAAICKITRNAPASVCSAAPIPAIESRI